MKYLISGGGTGGHIYPALAIAREIRDKDSEAEILYVGTKNGLEAELVPKAGLKFETIRVKGMPRKLNKQSFIALRELIYGLIESRQIIKKFKPDIVIGTGGYVSGPVVYQAHKLNVPTIVHEQNAFPGITNKILSRFVDIICVTFEEAKEYFKYPERVVITGNPIRKEILETNRITAFKKLNINPNKPFILSFGGSGGQKKLNECIYDIIKEYSSKDDFQIIHVTGTRFYDSFIEKLKSENIILNTNIQIVPYFYHMPEALNIANLVITSAGAITLAEVAAVGIPSILIPKGYTAENHQEYNARAFEKNGASIMLLEKDLTSNLLKDTIYSIINNKEKLKIMSINSKRLGKIDASSLIYTEIHNIIKKK